MLQITYLYMRFLDLNSHLLLSRNGCKVLNCAAQYPSRNNVIPSTYVPSGILNAFNNNKTKIFEMIWGFRFLHHLLDIYKSVGWLLSYSSHANNMRILAILLSTLVQSSSTSKFIESLCIL